MSMNFDLSIIIPVHNEAGQLADSLQALQPLRERCQLLVVDGGSSDDSAAVAAAWVDQVLTGPCGRARQMNVGAAQAVAPVLLFLHADTRLPTGALDAIENAVAQGHVWGRFDVAFDSAQPVFKLIAFMMNGRSRLTGIMTGDQALFVTREVFLDIGGFPQLALMEDIAISKRLNAVGKPACLPCKVVTSARRWQQHGVFKTILLMWRLRWAYFWGADPDDLAKHYYGRS